ncbi:MAG: tetratricopeptide repeat protein [Bacteroidetes bacterium]|jgi:tetratricopeptide (TPR) repeat protein|nr:tetratricopeptide repeat protein [Bacteroidota bacterium]MDA1019395.1 tetratricopeptide repeat protein [Bacteroidota bacterium]|tara:strand:+ start:9444 stop:10199 length:756 start_codon:yes stop_codon:yes gene_type:complete
MATYNKKGFKSKSNKLDSKKNESTTAEVFETLDQSASRTEQVVSKYQNYIIGFVGITVTVVLVLLGYSKLIVEPMSNEANNELFTAQNYFSQALINSEKSDSLFLLSLNGADGKYGFLDIISNYSGTDAADISIYSAGMAYYHLNDFKNSIEYLKDFDSDDEILKALAIGSIGDSFAELDQLDDALDAYRSAANSSSNDFTTPKFLLKAGNIATLLGNKKNALKYYESIKVDYPKSAESFLIDIQIEKNSL